MDYHIWAIVIVAEWFGLGVQCNPED